MELNQFPIIKNQNNKITEITHYQQFLIQKDISLDEDKLKKYHELLSKKEIDSSFLYDINIFSALKYKIESIDSMNDEVKCQIKLLEDKKFN